MNGNLRIARVAELAQKGLTKAQIAERMGLKAETVSTYLTEARNLGMPAPPLRHSSTRWTKHVSREAKQALRSHWISREMSMTQLLVAIVEAVARDGLVDAVMDDAPDYEGTDA